MKKLVLVAMVLLAGSVFGMTKQEVLNSIAANPYYELGSSRMVHQDSTVDHDIRWYQAYVLKINMDSTKGIGQTIDFYVMDEGKPTEWAVLKAALPTIPVIDQFTPAITTYLEGEQIILKTITTINVDKAWAECSIWEWDSDTSSFIAKNILVRYVNDAFTHNDITGG